LFSRNRTTFADTFLVSKYTKIRLLFDLAGGANSIPQISAGFEEPHLGALYIKNALHFRTKVLQKFPAKMLVMSHCLWLALRSDDAES